MRRSLLAFVWLCLLLPILAACAPAGRQPLELTAMPQYPNATALATPNPTEIAAQVPRPGAYEVYETEDDPGMVLTFYDMWLRQSGWHEISATPQPDARVYQWQDGCPLHYIDVKVTEIHAAKHRVEVKRIDVGC